MTDSPYSDGMNEHDQLREAAVRINQLEGDLRDLRDRLPGQTGRWVGEIILGIYNRGAGE